MRFLSSSSSSSPPCNVGMFARRCSHAVAARHALASFLPSQTAGRSWLPPWQLKILRVGKGHCGCHLCAPPPSSPTAAQFVAAGRLDSAAAAATLLRMLPRPSGCCHVQALGSLGLLGSHMGTWAERNAAWVVPTLPRVLPLVLWWLQARHANRISITRKARRSCFGVWSRDPRRQLSVFCLPYSSLVCICI